MHQLQVPQWHMKASSIFISLFSVLSFSSISPSHLHASYTDIKINTVCVWLVHRMHRHYRIHQLRMYDPPPPTFAPTIIPHHTYSLCNPPFLHLSLSLRMHARTAAVAPCSRHGWGDESKCELLREMKDLKNLTLKSRTALQNDEVLEKINDLINVFLSVFVSNTQVLEFWNS